MEQARRGKISGMYVVGENPALSFPNSRVIRETLASLEFLVVQDMFLTETARLAKVILPAASFAEKDGTFTNFEGRVRTVRKAIQPLGESLPDWDIVLRLAAKMGYPMPYRSLQEITDEITTYCQLPAYSAHEDSTYDGSPERIRFGAEPSNHPQVGRVHGGPFAHGFARFCPVEYVPLAKAKKGFPFTLLAGTVLYHLGTGSRSCRSARLRKFAPEPFVEICASDATKLAVADGEKVKLISPVGELTTTVRVTNALPEGIAFVPISFSQAPVNELFDIVLNPETKAPSLKACHVRIEKIAAN